MIFIRHVLGSSGGCSSGGGSSGGSSSGWPKEIVKLRQGSGKDRQGMAVKAKGLKA